MKRARLIVTANVALGVLLLAASGCGRGSEFEVAHEAASTTDGDAGTQADRCVRHGHVLTGCFICDATLRHPGRLWCSEHDRYEDRSFICHPELEDPERLWCSEHNLYEDECTLCRPVPNDSPSLTAVGIGELQCREHRVLEQECGICHPELAASLDPGSGLKIRFESARSAARAGVETARPIVESGHPDAAFLARVTWDQNHFARVTPLAGGVLQHVASDVGQTVARGERMATLISPEVSRAKSAYFSAQLISKRLWS